MAEKKKKTYVRADNGEVTTPEEIELENKKKYKQAKPVGNAKKKRIIAIILWVLALAFEVFAVFVVNGKTPIHFMGQVAQLIAAIVLDLACVIVGSQFWKQANHIDPASEENKVKFWLWNNMGVIVCAVAFIPFVIILLANKDLDKKTKAIATVVAVIALLIGGVSSYDFNPVSEEQLDAAVEALGSSDVYWSPFGHVYHTHDDCQSLTNSDELTVGSVDEAIAAGRTRLCMFCAKQDNITGVVTDDGDRMLESTDVDDEEDEEESGELIKAEDFAS